MVKYVATVCWSGKQMRLTVPKLAVRALKWESARFMLLEERGDGTLLVRRLLDGENVESDSKRSGPGSD